jgi:hypothetical protein
MPTLHLLVLLFGAWLIIGGIRTFHLLAASRSPAPGLNAIREWSERPLSSWRYEPYSAAAILLHTLAISSLGIAALDAVSTAGAFNALPAPSDTAPPVLLWIAEGGSISIVGFLVGSLVAFPLARLRRAPVAFAITEEGVVHGRTLMPWSWFSHFSIDSKGGVLRLYSAFSPDLASLISRPTPLAQLVDLGTALRPYLPTDSTPGNRAWYRTKLLLIPTMLSVCMPLSAVGWLATRLPRELALFAIALSTTVLALLGGRVISLFGFGIIKIRDDRPRPTPAA